jgi:hypothetical protein
VFTQGDFVRPLLNSLIVAVSTTAVTVVLASLAGYALARLGVRGRGAILALILLAGRRPVSAASGIPATCHLQGRTLTGALALVLAGSRVGRCPRRRRRALRPTVSASPGQAARADGSEARTMAILAEKTQRRGPRTRSALEILRAEALFTSTLQASERPSPDRVRRAVTTTLRRLGTGGCAAQLAAEFGDHPDLAAARMAWALATTRAVYPTPGPAPTARPLALAG